MANNTTVSPSINIRQKSATLNDILQHLRACDESHDPKLSDKVDIPSYAKKIFEQAETYEAWSNKRLIGLVAAYKNSDNTGFITNVSVTYEYVNRGIADSLMQCCVDDATRSAIRDLTLEVAQNNTKAIRLYEKYRFRELYRDGPSIMMLRKR